MSEFKIDAAKNIVSEEVSGPDTDVCLPQSDPHTCRLPFDIWCFSQSVSLHLHSQGVPRTPLSSSELSSLLSLSPAGVVLKLPLCI